MEHTDLGSNRALRVLPRRGSVAEGSQPVPVADGVERCPLRGEFCREGGRQGPLQQQSRGSGSGHGAQGARGEFPKWARRESTRVTWSG